MRRVGIPARRFLIPYSMEIQLYNYTGKANVINKALPEALTLTGNVGGVDIRKPTVTVTCDEVFNYNYCYISELKRYYFVSSVVQRADGVAALSLTCDVLTTFAKQIMQSKITVTTQTTDTAPYMSGNTVQYNVAPDIKRYSFADAFTTDGNIIMITLKGKN